MAQTELSTVTTSPSDDPTNEPSMWTVDGDGTGHAPASLTTLSPTPVRLEWNPDWSAHMLPAVPSASDKLLCMQCMHRCGAGPPTTWTILQNDDPNHLGMRCNAS